jgi:hypothetical protein
MTDKAPKADFGTSITVEELADRLYDLACADFQEHDPTTGEVFDADGRLIVEASIKLRELIAAARAHLSAVAPLPSEAPIEADVFVQNDDGVGFHKVFSTDATLPGGEDKDVLIPITPAHRAKLPLPIGDYTTDEYALIGALTDDMMPEAPLGYEFVQWEVAPPDDVLARFSPPPQGDAGECYSDGHDDYKWCSKHNAAWRNGDSNCSAPSPQGDAGEKPTVTAYAGGSMRAEWPKPKPSPDLAGEPDEPCHGPQDTTCPSCGLGGEVFTQPGMRWITATTPKSVAPNVSRREGDNCEPSGQGERAGIGNSLQPHDIAGRAIEQWEYIKAFPEARSGIIRAGNDLAVALNDLREALAAAQASAGYWMSCFDSSQAERCRLNVALTEALRVIEGMEKQLKHELDHVNRLDALLTAAQSRNLVLVETLAKVRAAIIEKAPDTLWAGLIETAIDCIDAALTTERDG